MTDELPEIATFKKCPECQGTGLLKPQWAPPTQCHVCKDPNVQDIRNPGTGRVPGKPITIAELRRLLDGAPHGA